MKVFVNKTILIRFQGHQILSIRLALNEAQLMTNAF